MYGELKMSDTNASTSLIERNKVFEYVRTMLGDGMVEVELDPIHYETAKSCSNQVPSAQSKRS